MSVVLAPGDRVDRYEVVGLLGEGGMASVYLVRHDKLGSEHVLKVLTVGGRALGERLMEEGRVQARLRHPNVVEVTDVVEVHGAPGLIMRYVRGPSLEDLLQHRRLSLEHVEQLVPRILAGVAAAHELGFVHRDLKPGNVLLSMEQGGVVPMVADFGLVKNTEEGGSKTRTGATMGTPHYLAPEQIRGAETVDIRADVWSLGVMCQELLTGELVFDAESVYDILTKVAELDFVGIDDLRPELPERIRGAIRGALRPRDDRWPTVQAFWAAWSGGDGALAQASAGPAPWAVDELEALVPPRPADAVPTDVAATDVSDRTVGDTVSSFGTWTDSTDTVPPVATDTVAGGLSPVPQDLGDLLPLELDGAAGPPVQADAPRLRIVLAVGAALTTVVAIAGLGVASGLGAATVPTPPPARTAPVEVAPPPAVELPEPAAPAPPAAPPPVEAPRPAPAPAPVPEEPDDMASWAVRWKGAPGTAHLTAQGATYPPGPVPAGPVELAITFGGKPETFAFELAAGDRRVFTCNADLRFCK